MTNQTINMEEELFREVVDRFGKYDDVLEIHIGRHLEEYQFFVAVTEHKVDDKEFMCPLFQEELNLKKIFPDNYLSFDYFPLVPEEKSSVDGSPHLIYQKPATKP